MPIFVAMAFRFFIDYLTHRLSAKTRHGTHSPFVYKLTDEVIYDFSEKKPYLAVEQQRKKLLNDDRRVVLDGLAVHPNFSKRRGIPVKQLVKMLLKKPKVDQLIFRLMVNQQPESILELGTSLGVTTAYLSKGAPKSSVVTVEQHSILGDMAGYPSSVLALDNVEMLNLNLEQLRAKMAFEVVDVICINSALPEDMVLQYFEFCTTIVNQRSMVIIDSIYLNERRKAIWTAIKHHSKVTVTIDLFWIGLVYFKTDQAEEHFKIKF